MKAKIEKDLAEASLHISEQEQRHKRTSERSLELLKALREAEANIETLKAYVIDLKSRIAVYIPVKGDAVDKKLAEYINNFPDR